MALLCLLALLGTAGQASVDRREIARISFTNETALSLDAVFFRHARTVCIRLDNYREQGENRWHEIRLTPDQWEKFKAAYAQGTRQLAEGAQGHEKLGTFGDFDQGTGSTLSLSINPKLKGLALTLYRPDPYTRAAGNGVRQVTIVLDLPAARQVSEQFAKADQTLESGPAPLLPAPTGPWKLKEVKVVNDSDGPGHFKVVRADAQAGALEVARWKLGWSFDQPVTSLQPNQKIKVTMTNQGPDQYGPDFPTMVLCLLTETQGATPLGDAYPDYRNPDPMPIYGFQYTPKDPNPAVTHYWKFTNQSKTLYPGKDEPYNDTKDGGKGTMVLQMNPSGYPYAMFYLAARTTQPFGGVSVCYLFERN